MIKTQVAAAFAAETAYRTEPNAVTVIDERLHAVTISPSEVPSFLQAENDIAGAPPASGTAAMVVVCDCLGSAFRPRAALDRICSRLAQGGRLIYGQRLTDQYLGLTPKWLLDYFITEQYADCRIYALWPPERNPAIATFDYQWMLAHAAPVYNPMWDNITYAEAVVVVAEKGAESEPAIPSQDIYRPAEEWERYAKVLTRLTASSRPCHLTGPAPDRLPAGYRECPAKATEEQPRESAVES